MNILTDELVNVHRNFTSYFTYKMENIGIETVLDYLNYIQRESFDDKKDSLQDVPLRALTRIYPGGSQDVCFLSLNPKVNENSVNILERLGSVEGGVRSYARTCTEEYQENYLDRSKNGTKNGYHHLISILNDEDIISYSEDDQDAYLGEKERAAVFDDIYFSNWFKMATPGQAEISCLPKELIQRSAECVKCELEAINPRFVFAFGNKTHEHMKEYVQNPITPEAPRIYPSNGEERHSHAYQLALAENPTMICVGHQNPRGGWYQYRESEHHPQIRDTLDYLLD